MSARASIILTLAQKGGEAFNRTLNNAAKGVRNVGNASLESTRKIENVGKASASAGRQFSAQAQGLGGLVAAYAGAAANIFALQQAFSALSAAARTDSIVRGVSILAREVGANGKQIVADLQAITQAQLNVAEAATAANLALSAGFSGDQLNNIALVAAKASKALGRDLTDSIQRLVRGAAKLEPELLDELGIIARIEPAVATYAREVGKAANELTQFERVQAFTNLIIDQGLDKFGAIDETADSAQKTLSQLSASLTNLGLELGNILANFAVPFIDFLTSTEENLLSTFAALSGLVLGRLTAEASKGIEGLGAGIVRFGEKSASVINFVTGRANTLNQELQNTQKLLENASRFRSVPVGGGKALNQTVDQLTRATPAQLQDRDFLIKQRESILQVVKAQQERIKTGQLSDRQLENSKKTVKTLTPLVSQLTNQINASSVAAVGASRAFNLFAGGVTLAARTVSGLITVISRIVTFVAIAQIFSSLISQLTGFENILDNIFTSIRDFVQGYVEETRRATQASSTLVRVLLEGNEALKDSALGVAERQEATARVAEAFENSIDGLSAILNRAILDANSSLARTLNEATLSGPVGDIARETLNSIFSPEELRELRDSVTGIPEDLERKFASESISDVIVRSFDNAESNFVEAVANASTISERRIARVARKAFQEERQQLFERLNRGESLEQAIRELEQYRNILGALKFDLDISDKSAQDLFESLESGTDINLSSLFNLEDVTDPAILRGFFKETRNGRVIVSDLGVEFGNAIVQAREFYGGIDEGTVNLGNALRSVGAVSESIDRLNRIIKSDTATEEEIATYSILRDALLAVREQYSEQESALIGLATQNERLTTTFKPLLEAANEFAAKGIVNDEGVVALDNFTETLNRVRFIGGEVLQDFENLSEALQDNDVTLTVVLDTLKALDAEITKLIPNLANIVKEQERQLLTLENQERVNRANFNLQVRQLEVAKAKADRDFEITKLQEVTLANLQAQLANLEAIASLETQRIDRAKELNDQANEAIDRQIETLNLEKQLADLEQRRINQQRDANLRSREQTQSSFPGLFSENQAIELRREVAREAFRQEIAAIQLERDNIRQRFELQRQQVRNDRLVLIEQIVAQNQAIQRQEQINNTRLAIASVENQIAQIQRENAIKELEDRKTIIDAEQKVTEARVQGEIELLKFEKELTDQEFESILLFGDYVDTFAASVQALPGVDGENVAQARDRAAQARDLATEASQGRQSVFEANISAAVSEVARARELAEERKRQLQEQIDRQKELDKLIEQVEGFRLAAIRAENTAASEAAQARLEDLEAERDRIPERLARLTLEERIANEELDIREQAAKDQLALVEQSAREQRDVIRKLGSDISNVLTEKVGQGIQDLSKAYFDGTLTAENFKQGVRDLFVGILDGIRERVTERLIVQPIEGLIQEGLGSIFGLGEERTGSPGSPYVVELAKNIPSTGDPFDLAREGAEDAGKEYGSLLEKTQAENTSFIDNIFGSNGILAQGLRGIGDIGASVFSGLGSVLQSIFNGITGGSGSGISGFFGAIGSGIGGLFGGAADGIFGSATSGFTNTALQGGASTVTSFMNPALPAFASGGLVSKMAQGGPTMLRDRVPALLEPGEFVMNKRAAQDIGIENLRAMNGTGNGVQNVSVNVINNGTPQETEGQPTVSFDGEKYVIDVILKDLRNNGPIRKGIRGNT